ncbi:hypothetical protein TVAG_018460 [Trichomonas vaginalis G3]|uniref:Uncharacterized protein n=1 Tax=Trichomonas vaginalis (strain ATCC PRA-98 / G3) TaxID=412133 RepID=A2F9Y2_TRIV3|nr:negative regulation of mitochondrial outer membrane permeabilization protein [Trichomonas vaginalis G3]EAX98310.1 hypothetical protein TVAG_018460 [Trichomonas vaginalis G3]KAI5517454.1 negative regulation of mitochondrial outer membrane permeabilization protein [Trichomonas vaginalis G3]|eukprot:XP_001311240.1 hypothetical protein [Trichomonas vaginalis G3]
MFKSNMLIIAFFLYPFLSCLFNISVLGTEFMFSAAKYLVLDIVVSSTMQWVLDLILFYSTNGKLETEQQFGTKWDGYSFIRLIGVIILVIGAIFYIKLMRLKCFEYEDPDVSVFKTNNDDERYELDSFRMSIV